MHKKPRFASAESLAALISFGALRTILLVSTGIVAAFLLAEIVRFLPVTADNAYPETSGILSAYRWANGLPLYSDYRQAPYLITPFPPLWYALLRLGSRLGFSTLDQLTLFGRLLTVGGLFGMVSLGYWWNRRLGFSRSLSLLTVTFYLTLPILIPWAVTARPDFIALSLGFFAIYWAGLRGTTNAAGVAGSIAGMAFLARHNAVAVPVAIVLSFLWSRKWKHALIFSVTWWLVVALTLLLFQRASHGMLTLNLSGAAFGEFSLSYIRDIAGRLLLQPGNGFVTALFAFGLFGFVQSWKQADQRIRLVNIYLVVALLLTVIGSAARGSAVNHYFEPAFAMALLIPAGVAQLQSTWRSDSPFAALTLAFVVVLLLPSLDVRRSFFRQNKPEDLRSLASTVVNRNVFTDIPYLAGRSAAQELLEPASLLNSERAGAKVAWSSQRIADDLNSKKYELVILSFPADLLYDPGALYPRYPHLDSTVRTAIRRNYAPCFEVDTSEVFGQAETRYVYGPLSTDGKGVNNCPFDLPGLTLRSINKGME